MNKITLTTQAVLHALNATAATATSKFRNGVKRVFCLLRGEKYDAVRGPQWQQLELPFSRTPVTRWNR